MLHLTVACHNTDDKIIRVLWEAYTKASQKNPSCSVSSARLFHAVQAHLSMGIGNMRVVTPSTMPTRRQSGSCQKKIPSRMTVPKLCCYGNACPLSLKCINDEVMILM
mmetsp:Transcript_23224/g.28451  ORF Transcript_23224/g.28451 Transcript_23224/m.28451 type:complete len:108 (+) Transcript_23224:191-514(+)